MQRTTTTVQQLLLRTYLTKGALVMSNKLRNILETLNQVVSQKRDRNSKDAWQIKVDKNLDIEYVFESCFSIKPNYRRVASLGCARYPVGISCDITLPYIGRPYMAVVATV